MNIIKKKNNLYYLILVLVAIFTPIIHYPRIYGVDAFQVVWMANALRNGALFSENTWLIHPASYFGYYPFSHRAIGVPMFLAFLISLLNFLSFGLFGLAEAILIFNIILIVIIYKSSRNLANRLFEEEWSRFVFVAAILLAPNIVNDTTMTISSRIIITIVMILLLNLTLKIISSDNNNSSNKFKTVFFLLLMVLVGSLAHRLWLGTLITIIFMIFTIFIRKYKKLHHISVILILPLSIIAFFYGLELYYVPSRIGFDDNTPFLKVCFLLITSYGFWNGLISVLFPFGLIITLYKLTFKFKNSNHLETSNKKKLKLTDLNQESVDKFYYLSLYIIPILFMVFTYFYGIVLFLPIIIIFSVQGLVYIKEFISNFSKKLDWVLPILLLFFVGGYYLLRYGFYSNFGYWDVFLFLFVSLILFLFVFLINNYKNLKFWSLSFDPHRFKKGIWIIGLTISFLAFSEINVKAHRVHIINSPYPWENRYLTDEDIKIIEYFQDEDIEGLIFVTDNYISERIGGVGFLPTFSRTSYLFGIPLFYKIINPNYVSENAQFSLYELFRLGIYTIDEINPIKQILNSISILDLAVDADFEVLVSYNIQYIISINETFQSGGINNWPLIQSLQQSGLFGPVFSTQHLLVWKIF